MRGAPGKTHCGRWIKADPAKHGTSRLVCSKPAFHGGGWHGSCGRVFRGTEDEARVKGWKIGYRNGLRDPLCPQCAKPDPVTAALARDLERSLR